MTYECKECGCRFSIAMGKERKKMFCPICGSENASKISEQISSPIYCGPKGNVFTDYTNYLAETLQTKNNAYGDSFGKSLDEDGLLVLKIRLGDKFNRISSLIKRGELKENDESLEDTLLDLAGYSILGLKYLKEHKYEEKD